MSAKKKDLEIVYNLEWKNKPANGDEKSNMVGILDIPATTLDWKTFKSYLLKNSGAADDNVKVSYIDTEDREKAINSQLDFEIALYTFRHKARMSEIITLKLDCVNSKKSGVKMIAKELSDMPRRLNPIVKKSEKPPEWFTVYMKKFKEELLDEISTICTSKTHEMNVHRARKLKVDRQRTRKTPLLFADSLNDKQLSNSAEMERKLESKLEKLEHKTMKIKAKKMALRGSSDSDVGRSSSKNDTFTYLSPTTNDMSMNASLLKKEPIPHMAGGESYCKTWEVSNSGTLPWTSSTGLRYAWGSQALKPLSKEVQCPPLQPGESGKICVLLEIPKIPGTYECYWHFYHEGRRFGHWLGCEIIVDGPPVKNVPFLPSPTYDVINIQDVYELVLPTCWTIPKKQDEPTAENNPDDFENPFENNPETKNQLDRKEENVKIETNPFSDSDNQSIISISDSSVNSATSEDFVLLRAPPMEPAKDDVSVTPPPKNVSVAENAEAIGDLFSKLSLENSSRFDCVDVGEELKLDCAAAVECKEEQVKVDELVQNQGQSLKLDLSATPTGIVQQIPIDLSNKSSVSEAEKEKNDVGYAYVHYKGRKIPISKKHLSPEFLVTAETVPESELKNFNKLKISDMAETEPVKEADAQIFRTSTPSCDVNSAPQHQADAKTGETHSHGQPQTGHSFCSLSMNNNIDCASNCGMGTSMSSSMNENRFFVFPQYYPGYEVVPPPLAPTYVDANPPGTMPFQPVYGYNTVGEVLVNDWTTGLNYTACVRYPNPPNQYYNGTSSTSRGCSSIPNSSIGSPLIHSPQLPPREHCPCQAENAKFEQNVNMNSTYEVPLTDTTADSTRTFSPEQNRAQDSSPRTNSRVPDILSGATVVATSAINTARSVLNMFVPPRAPDCGRWQNGHWISTNPESKREKNLQLLHDMGFVNRDLNATLLARYNDEIYAVLSDLLQ